MSIEFQPSFENAAGHLLALFYVECKFVALFVISIVLLPGELTMQSPSGTPLKAIGFVVALGMAQAALAQPALPSPLRREGQPANWIFVFKFNAKSFPDCASNAQRQCAFGGNPVNYSSGYGLQYVVASDADGDHQLKQGDGCIGSTNDDPIGATFNEVYSGSLNYVVWNDQFYNDPHIAGCGTSCASPWGHSKGVLAWDDSGNGLVLQVTTPSWPAAGNKDHPRIDGNSLGCVTDDNVLVSQDFFSLRLSPDDVVAVARALVNSSVVTDPSDIQIVKNGGPAAIQSIVSQLGTKSNADQMTWTQLSTKGVSILSKPSGMHAPPWQLVSTVLGSIDLLVASWWKHTDIPDTEAGTAPDCWPEGAGWKAPGAVLNAANGHWGGQSFSLLGVPNANGNHAKVGVSLSGTHHYAIFGDMNQEGALSGKCDSQQNGRGGMFFIVDDQALRDSVKSLISDAAPDQRAQ